MRIARNGKCCVKFLGCLNTQNTPCSDWKIHGLWAAWEVMVTVYYENVIEGCFDWRCIQAGREGRDKFGRREKRLNPNASSTNKEKRKTKNFMMVKHKVQKAKGKRSFHEKQVCCLLTVASTTESSAFIGYFCFLIGFIFHRFAQCYSNCSR